MQSEIDFMNYCPLAVKLGPGMERLIDTIVVEWDSSAFSCSSRTPMHLVIATDFCSDGASVVKWQISLAPLSII